MKNTRFFVTIMILLCSNNLFAQQKPLPAIMVKNINEKIVISWTNEYNLPIANLNIQSSFDSLRNYKTIGTVLSPQLRENGYVDANAIYNKMYYRVFVAFEGGTYAYSNIMRPIKSKDYVIPTTIDSTSLQMAAKKAQMDENGEEMPNIDAKLNYKLNPKLKGVLTNYPSAQIFTSKESSIVLKFKDAVSKNLSVKFFTENDAPVFEMKKVTEDYLVIEKVYFKKYGWYYFEVYDNGKLIEKSKFQILKEGKKL
jgi:hypothetical protein